MAGQKFQYDESGSTFVYFLLSFLALVLIPSTYYSIVSKSNEGSEDEDSKCDCNTCRTKQKRLEKKDPSQTIKRLLVRLAIVFGWILFIYVAYKTSQYDYELANFDPYEILGVELGSSSSVIKKAYHKLSLIHHPDKATGDEKTFMKLTKAYQALTDETARRNWELYGNPDGPGAVSFGIALPSWIVEKENSIWVLGLYALLFMVALPVSVCTWWYRSIRYSGDQVLLDTTQLYYYFFHKTPHMAIKRVLMILGASPEFHRRNNPEMMERPSDNVEVPQLMKRLPQLNEKNKERPLCFIYSIKARALLHAHLSRMPLPPNTLDEDRFAIVKKCPLLIQEMVVCVSQLIMLAHAGRLSRMPSLVTLEGCMKLSSMVVQALWECKSPLMQLCHVTDDNLKYFSSKRHQIRSLEQLARLKEEERRSVLHHMDDTQYQNVVRVLGAMPYVEMDIKYEVVDDEATTVYTAGAIVTVTVALSRRDLRVLFDKDNAGKTPEGGALGESQVEGDEDGVGNASEEPVKKKTMPWAKMHKKGKKAAANKKQAGGGNKKPAVAVKPAVPVSQKTVEVKEEGSDNSGLDNSDSEEDEAASSPTTAAPARDTGRDDEESAGNEVTADGDSSEAEADGDDQLSRLQSDVAMRRQRLLEGKSQLSHSVHCPYYPCDKQEYWWVYISDRKQQMLLTAPYHVTNLVHHEEIQLKFTAPFKPGFYTFAVCLRSDSYLGFDQMKEIKMDVKEAAEVPTEHPQWEISDDEEQEKNSGGSDSEFTTDDDDDHSDKE